MKSTGTSGVRWNRMNTGTRDERLVVCIQRMGALTLPTAPSPTTTHLIVCMADLQV